MATGQFRGFCRAGLAASAFALAVARSAVAAPVEPTLKLSAEQRYDDDVLYRETVNAPGQFLTRLTPQVGLEMKERETLLETFYAPTLFIRDNGGDLSVDHRGSFRLRDQLSRRSRLDVDADLWRTSDPNVLPRLGLARSLAPILYGRAGGTFSQRLTERWTGRLGYRFEVAKIDDVLPGTSRDAHPHPGFYNSPYVEGEYRITRRATLGAQYRLQLFNAGDGFANANGAALTYKYRITRSVNLALAGGAAYYHQRASRDPAAGAVQGWVPRFDVALGEQRTRADWSLNVGHDLVGASGFTTAVWADYASLVAGYRFAKRFRLFADGSYFRNGPVPNQDLFPLGWSRRDVSAGFSAGGGLEWQPAKAWVVQASYDRIQQVGAQVQPVDAQGKLNQLDLTRNVVALRLIVTAL